MARFSNIILGILNFLVLIIGIGIIAWVISIRDHWETECLKMLLGPLMDNRNRHISVFLCRLDWCMLQV